MPTETKRLAPLQDRYAGQHILLTGATGLLAKSVLEKILRDLPSVEKVHLLVRPRRSVDAAERIEWEIVRSPMFDRLRNEWQNNFHSTLSSKVVPVSGDLARRHLGLDDAAYEKLAGEVTMIINCGATCSFREQFDRALQINALGARRILKLAQDAGNVPLVHVSTAYVYETAYAVSPERVIPDGHTLRSAARRRRQRGFLSTKRSTTCSRDVLRFGAPRFSNALTTRRAKTARPFPSPRKNAIGGGRIGRTVPP